MKHARLALFALAGLLLAAPAAHAQKSTEKRALPKAYRYRVGLTDKKNNPYSLKRPAEFLSQKSLERRRRYGLKLDWHDLPVTPTYLQCLRDLGLRIHNMSKWQNTVVVETPDTTLMQAVRECVHTPLLLHGIEAFNDSLLAYQQRAAQREQTENLAASADAQPASQLAVPADSLLGITDPQELLAAILAPFRGRAVYIDFWGTWCGPCREEMEHLPALHEALADLPVTYIYLANNSPEELWRKSAAHYGLGGIDCVNLRLSNSQQQAVENHLNVHGYPTYILVAPDGTIARSDAPRPSQPALVREAILKLIEKSK